MFYNWDEDPWSVTKKAFISIFLKIWLLHKHFQMILKITAKYKSEEHLSVAASVKSFLFSMAKIFSFSKLLH